MPSIDSRPREPENGPVRVYLALQDDQLVCEVPREVEGRISRFAQSIQDQLDGQILRQFVDRGPGFISEWLNSSALPLTWLGSAQAVRELVAQGYNNIAIEDVFEPQKCHEVLEKYFARNVERQRKSGGDPELLCLLIARQLQLKDTVFDITHPSLNFVALCCSFIDGAITSRNYFIAERPREYIHQVLKQIAQLNTGVQGAIEWVVQSWTELSAQGEELRRPKNINNAGETNSLFPATYQDFERLVEKGISLANEVLRAELQIRGIVRRAIDQEPLLWSEPAQTIALSLKDACNQVVVIDDQSEYGHSYRAPKSATHLARFRAHLLEELDKTAGFSTWAILDGRKQWENVLVEGLKMGATDLPTVDRVLESVRLMAEARYVPDGAQELLKAVQVSPIAYTLQAAPSLEFWCNLLKGARDYGSQIAIYDSKDVAKSNAYGREAFSLFMKSKLEGGERVAIISYDAEQLGLPRLRLSGTKKIALFSGLTSHGCVSQFINRMVFLYATNEVMMQSAGASAGAEQCVGLQVNNPHFLEEIRNVRGGDQEGVRLDWFGGEYDYVVVAGGRKDSDRAGHPGRGRRRFVPTG